MTRVRVDMNLCQSNGQCELVAPEISELDDGVLRWKEEVSTRRCARGRSRRSRPLRCKAIRAQD
jgi:ferredoxin